MKDRFTGKFSHRGCLCKMLVDLCSVTRKASGRIHLVFSRRTCELESSQDNSPALLMLNVPYPSIGLTEGRMPINFVACIRLSVHFFLTMGTLKSFPCRIKARRQLVEQSTSTISA
jgi:hypothetical protein